MFVKSMLFFPYVDSEIIAKFLANVSRVAPENLSF